MSARRPTPTLLIGLFFGALLGSAGMMIFSSKDTSETYLEYQQRMAGGGARPTAPPGGGAQDPHGGGAPQDRAAASQAKAHFMKKFVAALSAMPQNRGPNPQWRSQLREGADPIECADCHDPTKYNVEGMKASDPGSQAVEPFRKDPAFMIPLMRAWVKRLNARHSDRLVAPVTCTTCHEENPETKHLPPEQRQARAMAYAYFMKSFVEALSSAPTTNREPASGWKPLLKDPAGAPVKCSLCHTANMDGLLAQELERPERLAREREWVAELMEQWVEKLNRLGGDRLTKVVTCLDCHERDPRR